MYYRAVDFAPRELRPLHTNLANTPRALTFTIKSLHQKKKKKKVSVQFEHSLLSV